ncbi:MAG TPA: orotidine 5'-phosphate decarboxylase [Nitrososphaerales archaeon]|nr:orotidine 5'-phosphate decarboxylase [Nitrososphaerales archaeon]
MKFADRMRKSSAARGSKVVLALDFSDPYESRLARAEGLIASVKDVVAAVKVNHHLLLPYGLRGLAGVIDTCREGGIPLIADLKMNDIEATNLNIVDSLFAFGFDAVIANPFVGWEEGLGKAIERVHAKEGGMLLLVYMSHRGADEGYGLKTEGGEPLYRVFARRAKDWEADGVVVSAKSVDKISEVRGIVGKDCLIFSPGVGAQGGDLRAGAGGGSDFVIVGRSVTEASDPLEVLHQLNGA